MSLTPTDLKKIGALIKSGYEYLDAKWDKRFTQLELKFDMHIKQNEKQFKILDSKIDQLIRTEKEDVVAIFNDVESIKTRLKKANI